MSHAAVLQSPLRAIWRKPERRPTADCVLGLSRVALAFICGIDLWWWSGSAGSSLIFVVVLFVYSGLSAAAAAGLCLRPPAMRSLRRAIPVLDASAVGLLALVDDPFGLPFFLLLSFTVVHARYAGGVRQTVATTLAVAVGLAVRPAARPLLRLFGLALVGSSPLAAAHALILAVAGALFTWCSQKRRAAADRASATARLLGSLRPELSVAHVLRSILGELLWLDGAHTAVLALEHRATGRLLVAAHSAHADTNCDLVIRRRPRRMRSIYFFEFAQATSDHIAQNAVAQVQVLETGARSPVVPAEFRIAHPFDRLDAFAFRSGDEWEGRLFLLDPADQERRSSIVGGIADLLREVVPAVAGISDLHSVRRRAAARERARLGRELHDGIVQQLVSIDVELELIRRAADENAQLAGKLGHLQECLHEELSNLRVLLQKARGFEVDPARLPMVLGELVERFGRETGISARFVLDADQVRLPSQICGEIVRIVQEALVNVRRHSGARTVVVRLWCIDREWRLSVHDDGRGLPASRGVGECVARPPAVIEERVHIIGGRVKLSAAPGHGARLDIAWPEGGPWPTT